MRRRSAAMRRDAIDLGAQQFDACVKLVERIGLEVLAGENDADGSCLRLADPDGEDAVNEETPGCPQQAGLTLFFVLPLGGWADARRRPERFTIVIHRQSLDVQGEMAT